MHLASYQQPGDGTPAVHAHCSLYFRWTWVRILVHYMARPTEGSSTPVPWVILHTDCRCEIHSWLTQRSGFGRLRSRESSPGSNRTAAVAERCSMWGADLDCSCT